jgi:hypothetical protein
MFKWRFLTRSFVEALGLPQLAVVVSTPVAAFVAEGAASPRETRTRIEPGVKFDGALYVREGDGLAWKRVENA